MLRSAGRIAPQGRQWRALAQSRFVEWARHVAEHQQIPLAVVLAWPPELLEVEIARALVDIARIQAQRLMAHDPPGEPPTDDDLVSMATRAIAARLKTARDAAEEAEADAAWDELEADFR